MSTGSKLRAAVFVGILLFLSGGCGDDSTTPEGFQVVITVHDTQGNPVSGLDLTMVPDGPWYMDPKKQESQSKSPSSGGPDPTAHREGLSGPSPNPFFPATSLRFMAAYPCSAFLTIEDVELGRVKNLVGDEISAGYHTVMWNGTDEGNQLVPSGVYQAHLVLSELAGGGVLFDGRQPMLLAHWGEGDTPVATSDGSGRITLTDQKLFPYLYDLEPIPGFNENGEMTGYIELSPAMRFYLSDPVGMHTMRFDEDVTGRSSFNFTWEY